MTPQATLGELLTRLAASRDATIYVSDEELAGWPLELVAELKESRVLVRASPAASAICPGCERECVMPVEVLSNDSAPVAFIVCDKRNDINRVEVPVAVLSRWKGTGATLADSLAQMLNLAPRPGGADTVNRWTLGMVEGKHHKDRLVLHASGNGLTLAIAGHTVALDDVLGLEEDAILVDLAHLRRLVDQPTGGTAREAESPDERRDRLVKRRDALKAKGVRNFLQRMAEEEGVSTSALKQVMARPPKAGNAMSSIASALAHPTSKKSKTQR